MLYHITTLENARKILEEGLIANIDTNSPLSEKGYIYLFENKSYKHPLRILKAIANELQRTFRRNVTIQVLMPFV